MAVGKNYGLLPWSFRWQDVRVLINAIGVQRRRIRVCVPGLVAPEKFFRGARLVPAPLPSGSPPRIWVQPMVGIGPP